MPETESTQPLPQHPAAPETETETSGAGNALDRAVDMIASLTADLDAARERVRVVEGERDAAREQGTRLADGLYRWRDDAERYLARAESAEAAHEAEKAAHERLRAGVEALADEWEAGFFAFRHQDPAHLKIRALLGGGGAR